MKYQISLSDPENNPPINEIFDTQMTPFEVIKHNIVEKARDLQVYLSYKLNIV